MALPPRAPENQDQRSLVAATRRREAAQYSAVVASQLRRRANIFTDTPPVETTTLRRHVLQSDFANVVGSPSPGAVEVEVVFDGDQIRFYVVP